MTFGMIPEPVAWSAAILVFGYLVWWTWRRLMGDRSDPTFSVSGESRTGSATFLLSGTALMLAGTMIIAALIWPAPVRFPVIGILLVGIVGAHWWWEREERR